MSKLALTRAAIRSSLAVRTIGSATHRHGFSTESDPPTPQQSLDSSVDSFIQSQSAGSLYWRLFGISKNTLRADVANNLEGCNLTLDDVKVEYSRDYQPVSMMVRFESSKAYEQAMKMISRRGRVYKLEKVGQDQWDNLAPYEGKAVLVKGLPQTASTADLERFLSGCNYYDNSIQFFLRTRIRGKVAIVRFPSQTEAMNCFITKNKSFCQNNEVQIQVLQ